jgi:5-methyltetrahydrofolate--homocysteine methyltransferase
MITKNNFLNILGNTILIGDGAMGTVLQGLGIFTSPDLFISKDANAVEILSDIHLSYLKSGSDIIQASTFGANPVKLEAEGLLPEIKNINEKAVYSARIAVDKFENLNKNSGAIQRQVFIAGNLGPTGKLLEPFGDLSYKAAVEAFQKQADILVSTKMIDVIIIETMMDLNEALAAVEAVKNTGHDLPVLCTLTFNENGVTLMGNKAGYSIKTLLDAGCAAAGANCSVGSDKMLDTVRTIREYNPGARLIFQPNAGMPVLSGGQTIYSETPEIMAGNIKNYLEYKPSIIGACCGSTPEHIRKIAGTVKKQG